jgi:hypothetical protein
LCAGGVWLLSCVAKSSDLVCEVCTDIACVDVSCSHSRSVAVGDLVCEIGSNVASVNVAWASRPQSLGLTLRLTLTLTRLLTLARLLTLRLALPLTGSLSLCAGIEECTDVQLSDLIDEVSVFQCVSVGITSDVVQGGQVELCNTVR